MKNLCAVILFLHLYLIQFSRACNGHDIKVTEIGKCNGSDEIIRVSDDFNLKLTKGCTLVASGCLYNKAFSLADMEFSIKSGNDVILSHSEDLCRNNIFGAACPIDQGKRCFNNGELKWNLKPFRRLISSMVGLYEVNYIIHHDKATSCGKLKYRIVKK